jgi:hypothetical protein
MTTSKLPAHPSLESLRKQAKKLARGIVAGNAAAIGRARAEAPGRSRSGLDRVDGIKLDVEGAEIMALRGARDTIERFKPTVIFERTSPGAKRLGPMENVPSLLAAHGYHLYQYSRTGFNHPNFVAIHSDRGTVPPTFLESCSVNNCIS